MTTPVILSVAKALAFAKTSHAPIAVVDSGSAIAANADALAGLGKQLVSAKFTGHINYFPWVIDVAGVLALAPKLTNFLGVPVSVFYNVTDTAANIIANAHQLLALAPLGIELTLTITDTAKNVAAHASRLLALAGQIPVGGIHVTDTASNIAANASALALLGAELSVTVSDTAAHINNNQEKLLSLGNALHGFALPDGKSLAILHSDGNSVTLDTALAIVFVKEGLTAQIHVVDSSGNIANHLDALAAMGGQLLSVQDTSDYNSFSWQISVVDVLLLASKMTDKYGSPGVFGNVTGSAALVATHAAALLALGPQIGYGSIQITDSAANVAANAGLLASLGVKLSLTINDTAAHVAAHAAQLLTLGTQIGHSSINITDTAAHVADNSAALSILGAALSVTIKDSAAAVAARTTQLLTLGAQIPTGGIQVNDTAANVAAHSTALAALGTELSLMVTDTVGHINASQLQLLSLGLALSGFNLPDGTTLSNLNADGQSVTLDASQAVIVAKEGLAIPVHVVDSIDNITKNLSVLAALGNQLLSLRDASIYGTFTGQISVADLLALAPKMISYYGIPYSFNRVTDTAANVAGNVAQLLALGSRIATGGIHVTDTVAHIATNAAQLAKLGIELTVIISDRAVNVAAHTSQLLALGGEIAIGSIQITDTAANIAANATVLGKLGTELSVAINDTAANVASKADQLIAMGAQIPAGSIHITDTAGAIAANAAALAKLGARLSANVNDTVAHINANQDKLLSLGNALDGFTLPGGTSFSNFNASGTSLTLDISHAFAFVKAGLTAPIHVVDSGANMAKNLDALAAIGKQLLSLQDNAGYYTFVWQISVVDVLALAPKMSDYYGNPSTFNHITDTAASIAAHAAQLFALGPQIANGGIRITDTAAHIAAYQGALATLGADLSVTIIDTAANVATNAVKLLALGNQIVSGGIHVTDSAADIAANTSALATLDAKLSVTVNDSAANINSNQDKLLSLGKSLSGLILPDGTSFYNLLTDGKSVTLDAAQATNFAKEGLVVPIHLVDSSWNISNHLDALAALGSQLLSIKDSSGYSPFFWQISVADLLALAPKITDKSGNPDTFSNITDSAANVAAHATGLLALGAQITNGSIHITDTAAHITANAAALATLAAKLSITINDSAANVAANVAQLVALGTLIPAGAIHITGTAADIAAHAAALASLGAEAIVTVTDTVAQINANQAKLLSLGGALEAFKLPDGTSISNLGADGKSVTLDVSQALAFVKEGLAAPIHIVDYSGNMSDHLDALAAMGSQLLSVQDSSGYYPFPWQISVADALVLVPKTTNYWGHPDTFNNITDSVANVAKNASQLFALGLQIATGGIHVSDTAAHVIARSAALSTLGAALSITIIDTATNVAANAAQLLALGTRIAAGGIQVTDTAANIANNVVALATLGTELSVTVNDTAAQINANQAKLLSLGGVLTGLKLPDGTSLTSLNTDGKAVTLDVSHAIVFFKEGLAAPIHVVDSSGNIASNLDSLAVIGNQLLSVQNSSGENTFYWSISVADVLALAPKLTDSSGKPSTFNDISDTAANVAVHIGQLLALGTKIVAGGLHITDTAANIASNAKALAKLGNELSVTIIDTAANVAGKATQLLALETQIANGGIQVSDTAANVATNATALIKLGNKLSVTVADTVAHINANQAKLLSLGYALRAFTLPDGLSFGQFGNLLSDGKSVTLSNVYDAILFVQEGLSAPIHLVDSGWSMSGSLHALAAMGAQLLSVQDNTGTSPFTWQINIADVLVLAPKMTDSKGSQETFSAVADTAANLVVQLDGLENIAGQIANIKLTDAGIPNLTITSAQFAQDATVLGKISSPYSLSISGETAANVAADANNSHVTAIAVADTAAHISASLNSLESNISKLSGITLTDQATAELALTVAQTNSNVDVLNAISSPYLLSVQDSVANINGLALGGIKTNLIEIMPTSLQATLTETYKIADLNLSQISLADDYITEKAYNTTGTEIDIVANNGSVLHQLLFTNTTESQLHLLGIGTTVVHAL